ncbi:MAG: hypothetical protein P8Q97_14115 [Myxococcota bacterium]|nr:hypothetical protein [Myxococcota bacterium]
MRHREERDAQIAKVPLQQVHVQDCELLLDRGVMLDRLPKAGVVAEIGVDRGDFSKRILAATEPEVLHLVDVWES